MTIKTFPFHANNLKKKNFKQFFGFNFCWFFVKKYLTANCVAIQNIKFYNKKKKNAFQKKCWCLCHSKAIQILIRIFPTIKKTQIERWLNEGNRKNFNEKNGA